MTKVLLILYVSLRQRIFYIGHLLLTSCILSMLKIRTWFDVGQSPSSFMDSCGSHTTDTMTEHDMGRRSLTVIFNTTVMMVVQIFN